MILNCKYCPYQAKSLDLDKTVALKEVSDKITRHIVSHHPKEQQKALQLLAKVNMGLTWYIVITGFCDLGIEGSPLNPLNLTQPIDPYIKEQLEKVEGEIARLIGFEAESEEGGGNGKENRKEPKEEKGKIIT